MTGPRDGGKKQIVKCLNILGEQIIDLENLSDLYKHSQDSLDTALFNKFLGEIRFGAPTLDEVLNFFTI